MAVEGIRDLHKFVRDFKGKAVNSRYGVYRLQKQSDKLGRVLTQAEAAGILTTRSAKQKQKPSGITWCGIALFKDPCETVGKYNVPIGPEDFADEETEMCGLAAC